MKILFSHGRPSSRLRRSRPLPMVVDGAASLAVNARRSPTLAVSFDVQRAARISVRRYRARATSVRRARSRSRFSSDAHRSSEAGYSHATFKPPPSSRHLQLEPSTRVTQPQLGFSAHSANQLHAPPPLAFSSQYQPVGQMPVPHLLHVPSSQLGPVELSLAALLAGSSSSESRLVARLWWLAPRPVSAERPVSSAADWGPSWVAGPPPH